MITASVNTQKFSDALRRMMSGINIEQANQKVSIDLYGWVLRNFDSEGGLVGGWVPLKPSTIKEKERAGLGKRVEGKRPVRGTKGYKAAMAPFVGSQKMLVRSGNLRASFMLFYDDKIAGVGASAAKFPDGGGDYARAHQYGDPARHIPARPMLPPMNIAAQIGTNVYGKMIKDAQKGAGL